MAYQELDRFTLPNSRLQAYCSILYYQFQDKRRAEPSCRMNGSIRIGRPTEKDEIRLWNGYWRNHKPAFAPRVVLHLKTDAKR